MGTQKKHIIIVAGEVSGDMRAAELVNAIKILSPDITFSGVGGDCMQRAGVVLFENITSLAVIGIAEVVKNLGRIKKVFDHTLKEINTQKPDAVILVDYPGFNLRLAKELKKRNIKVIYYISPQVWAWRQGRIHTIKKIVNRMMVLFPFEKDLYTKFGMNVDYVGHPLVDEIKVNNSSKDVLKSVGLDSSKTTIGLMPGSRQKEVERHLPVMIQAATRLFKKDPRRQFLLLKASTIQRKLLESHLPASLPIKIYEGNPYNAINAMDAVIVASGTATLEIALLNKPMVIIYKTSWPTYAIAKQVIKIPYIGLVNIVAGKQVAPELIQNNCNPLNIATSLEVVLGNKGIIEELKKIKTLLGESGASLRAAKVVLQELAR
jgi:lipid-A-disaccharide synthase